MPPLRHAAPLLTALDLTGRREGAQMNCLAAAFAERHKF